MVTKNKVEILPNGLTLVYIKTSKKNAKSASLFVKFGGFNKKVILNKKEISIKDGTAHFLEHLLIEKSMYGNMIINYNNNNVRTNGQTSSLKTEYWFQTTKDFEENLVKLINMVNNPVFNQEDIDEIKDAIIQEKLERDDDKYYQFYSSVYECLFTNLTSPNVLGEVTDIKNMKYDYIKNIYNAFYQPSNQILAINGNLNYQKIKKLIIETYDKLKIKPINYQIPKLNLTDKIAIETKTIIKDVPNQHTRVVFKNNITKYTPLQKLKLDWYMGIYMRYVLNELNEEIVKNKISSNVINFYQEYIENYSLMWLSLQTNKTKEYLDTILNKLGKTTVPREAFESTKTRNLITILLREESCYGNVNPFVDNILSFNYFKPDTSQFIESLNYQEFNNMIKEVNFSNYIIINLKKQNKNE